MFFCITFSAVNIDILNAYLKVFETLCTEQGILYSGPMYLPKLQKQFIFLKPVHIYKKSGTGFETSTYKRLVIIECVERVYINKVLYFLVFLQNRVPLGICLKITCNF